MTPPAASSLARLAARHLDTASSWLSTACQRAVCVGEEEEQQQQGGGGAVARGGGGVSCPLGVGPPASPPGQHHTRAHTHAHTHTHTCVPHERNHHGRGRAGQAWVWARSCRGRTAEARARIDAKRTRFGVLVARRLDECVIRRLPVLLQVLRMSTPHVHKRSAMGPRVTGMPGWASERPRRVRTFCACLRRLRLLAARVG